ncbi:hypothetical protein [Sorangium cellulosum]|uniref:hypothetical protein n=1 Tax=Sorangium cellulosum TaxID=56 RepID=UPI00041CBFBC|nr:hypothetical protein [Sorangium cellulosum]
MKKIARLALAFAAVMSVSGSAMAINQACGYDVVLKNGLRKIPAGKFACGLAEQSGDLWRDDCVFACKWGVMAAPGAAVSANLILRQATTLGHFDCDMISYQFTDSDICMDSFGPNYGIDTKWQKAILASFIAMEDGENGVMKSVLRYYSPLSFALTGTFTPSGGC